MPHEPFFNAMNGSGSPQVSSSTVDMTGTQYFLPLGDVLDVPQQNISLHWWIMKYLAYNSFW